MNLRRVPGSFRKAVLSTRACAALGVCALLGACATEPIPTGSRLVITSAGAQFYKNGPAQEMSFSDPQLSALRTLTKEDSGPDGQLSKGAHVTLVKREIGFSRVMTENGTLGYVANDQMQRAPVAIARATIPVSRPRESVKSEDGSRRQKMQKTQPAEEKLDLLDLPLPLPG